ncbi:ABC transporter substrate-binding protein [Streptomyces africanus]|uniref:ABC transporter substrate-binding protein n=1 Tax=Streptomyces africanus TaxID=231024 RepID=UPI000A3C234D|nr:ABC transporter substrate-binding protein [Streptomyces africanus]
MPRRAAGTIAVLCSALLLTSACTGDPVARPGATVTLGFLAPLSGPAATVGADTRRGAELAVKIVNDDAAAIPLPLGPGEGLPRADHARIRLLSADTAASGTTGAGQLERLVRGRGAVAVAGGYESAVTRSAGARAEELRIPFVNGGSSAASLTERGLDWFFRTGPSDLGYGRVVFSLLKERQSEGTAVRRIAVVHTDDQYGEDGSGMIKRLASQVDGDVVADVEVSARSTDLSGAVAEVRGSAPDVVLTLLYTPQALALSEEARAVSYEPPALMAFGGGYADPAFVRTEGGDAEGICSRFAWSADLATHNPAARAVADLYRRTYRSPMNDDAARAFTAVMTLAQAVDEAASPSPADIRSALVNLDVPGRDTIMPWDGVKFDDNHQNTGARGVVEQIQKGRYRLVYPFDVARARLRWPMP